MKISVTTKTHGTLETFFMKKRSITHKHKLELKKISVLHTTSKTRNFVFLEQGSGQK